MIRYLQKKIVKQSTAVMTINQASLLLGQIGNNKEKMQTILFHLWNLSHDRKVYRNGKVNVALLMKLLI